MTRGFFLKADALNELQIKSLRRAIEKAKQAHHTDIDMRINGDNVRFEADWLKHMQEVE